MYLQQKRRVASNKNWNKVGGQRGQTAPVVDNKMPDTTSELEAEASQVTASRGGLEKEITRHQEVTEDQNLSCSYLRLYKSRNGKR